MANEINRIGEFSEQGRGVPISLSRPGGALPYSPLVRQAYAPTPRARLGWAQGVIRCDDVPLEAPRAIAPTDPPSIAAARMRADDAGFVPVVEGGRFIGVVFVEELLRLVADKLELPTVQKLVSEQIPTCAPESALVDAVRQMLACYVRKIPVVGDGGALVGMLTLSTAAAAADRDPAVRDVLESGITPSAFARRFR